MDHNPSIFIRLPRLPGTKWVPADIVDVIDKYGDIKEVSINKDGYGGQFAVVHFNEWYYPEGMKIVDAVHKGKPVRIRALYRKYFNLILFKAPSDAASKVVKSSPKVPVAPGISFGNPGQLNAAEFLEQKKQNEIAAFNFQQILDYHNDNLVTRRHRSDSGVSDITMEDNYGISLCDEHRERANVTKFTEEHYEGKISQHYRHYELEEGEIV